MIVDSQSVDRVLAPASIEELADAMGHESGTIAPVGSGSALSSGNPLGPIDSVMDTRRLNRITEYVPADLTVHVEAGIRLGDLQDALAEHNQMLPLDPWNGKDRTIGGIVATNAQGPLRAVGTVRDWIIGMKVVDADGRISRTGGRVVKNVSGYDLAKLYTGSLGSLAVISEVSFKVSPRYPTTATARLGVSTLAEASEIVRSIRASPLNPVSFVWLGPEHSFYIRFGDTAAAVQWQLDHLPGGDWERLDPDAEPAAWESVREFYERLGDVVARVAVSPLAIGDVLNRFEPASWLGHAARGIVLISLPPEVITALRQEFPVVVERAPLEVRRRVPAFGLRGAEHRLMVQIKNAFDPDHRLNPGRHVDGERPQ